MRPTTTRPGRLRTRLLASSASILTVPLLAGCASDGDGPKPGATGTTEHTVVMRLITFKPARLAVAAGITVTWQQQDAGVHTVTSGAVEQQSGGVREVPDGRFDSGQIATDRTFRHTFAEAGTYAYFCGIHPATMRGQVTVT